jgi:hypothetical protein
MQRRVMLIRFAVTGGTQCIARSAPLPFSTRHDPEEGPTHRVPQPAEGRKVSGRKIGLCTYLCHTPEILPILPKRHHKHISTSLVQRHCCSQKRKPLLRREGKMMVAQQSRLKHLAALPKTVHFHSGSQTVLWRALWLLHITIMSDSRRITSELHSRLAQSTCMYVLDRANDTLVCQGQGHGASIIPKMLQSACAMPETASRAGW